MPLPIQMDAAMAAGGDLCRVGWWAEGWGAREQLPGLLMVCQIAAERECSAGRLPLRSCCGRTGAAAPFVCHCTCTRILGVAHALHRLKLARERPQVRTCAEQPLLLLL